MLDVYSRAWPIFKDRFPIYQKLYRSIRKNLGSISRLRGYIVDERTVPYKAPDIQQEI